VSSYTTAGSSGWSLATRWTFVTRFVMSYTVPR
jgi:hypothetical protein